MSNKIPDFFPEDVFEATKHHSFYGKHRDPAPPGKPGGVLFRKHCRYSGNVPEDSLAIQQAV